MHLLLLCIERLLGWRCLHYLFEQCPSSRQWRLLVPVLCIYPLIGMSGARCPPCPLHSLVA